MANLKTIALRYLTANPGVECINITASGEVNPKYHNEQIYHFTRKLVGLEEPSKKETKDANISKDSNNTRTRRAGKTSTK